MKEIDWEGLERLYGWSREEAEQKMRQAWAFWLEQTKRDLQDVQQDLARYVELLGKTVLTVEEYLALGGRQEGRSDTDRSRRSEPAGSEAPERRAEP